MTRFYALLLMFLTACSADTTEDTNLYPSGPAVCDDGSTAPSLAVEEWATTQAGPNAAVIHGDYLYVLESQANTVSRVHLDSSVHEPWVDVGNDRNPYDLVVTDDSIFITNYLSNSVTVASLDTGEVIREIISPDFSKPSGVAFHAGHLYVGNVNYIGPAEGFGDGSLSIINLADDSIQTRPTHAKNPQYLATVEHDGATLLLVSETGSVGFEDGIARPDSEGALEVFDLTTPIPGDSTAVPLPVSSSDNRIGAPGRPALPAIGSRLFIPSGTAPALFEFDLDARVWTRDSENPIQVHDAENNALMQANTYNGLVYVSAFTRDALYIIDPNCDEVLAGPINLGQSNLLEGPLPPLLHKNGSDVDLFTPMSVANSLTRVQVRFD